MNSSSRCQPSFSYSAGGGVVACGLQHQLGGAVDSAARAPLSISASPTPRPRAAGSTYRSFEDPARRLRQAGSWDTAGEAERLAASSASRNTESRRRAGRRRRHAPPLRGRLLVEAQVADEQPRGGIEIIDAGASGSRSPHRPASRRTCPCSALPARSSAARSTPAPGRRRASRCGQFLERLLPRLARALLHHRDVALAGLALLAKAH